MTINYIIISLGCFFIFSDIFTCHRLADTRIAARRTTVRNLHSAANPVSRISRPERLRQTESERYRCTVHTAECQKVHGGQGLAVVATIGQDHAPVERAPDRIRTQTEIREYLIYIYYTIPAGFNDQTLGIIWHIMRSF